MTAWRRIRFLAATTLLAAVGAGSTGCSTSGAADDAADPSSTAAASVVWQESTTSPSSLDPAVPRVTVYEDGRVFVSSLAGGTAQITTGTADREALDRFLASVDASGLFEPGAGFGEPGPSDHTEDVAARIDGELRNVSFPSMDPGTSAQAARRAELERFSKEAAGLAGDLEPWTPDRVAARAAPMLSDEVSDPSMRDVIRPVPWPGPSLDTFADADPMGSTCLVVEGEEAATVYEAASENVTGMWTTDDDVVPIIVTPLLPGQEGCTR